MSFNLSLKVLKALPTNDLWNKVKLHNEGKGEKYTRDRRLVKLARSKEYKYFKKAFLEEVQLKKLMRKQKEKLINSKIRPKLKEQFRWAI